MKAFIFKWVGLLICAIKGQLAMYPFWVAQAYVETDNLKHHFFTQSKNPWCMHNGPKAKRAIKDGKEGVAAYKSYWRAWLDRIAWDGSSADRSSYPAYSYWLSDHGWAMGLTDQQYWEAISSKWDELPLWWKRMTLDTGDPVRGQRWRMAVAFLVIFGATALLALLLWLVWRLVRWLITQK